MQNKDIMDFDGQLRSILADAELKPSRSAWKAISSRLDAAEAAQAPAAPEWGRFAWAGVAMAFACMAVGIFLIGPGLRDTAPEAGSVPMIASASPMITTEYEGPEVSFEQYKAGGMLPSGISDETAALLSGVTAEAESGSSIISRDIDELRNSRLEGMEPREGLDAGRTSRTAIGDADPLAVLMDMDNRARKNPNTPSFYAEGLIGGNNSDGAKRRADAMFAPGEGSGGINELSTSSYGVPFSVGLGVRFYLAPKLSVGTGLDYTLLTRTFTGEYGDYAGPFLHSLQYVGIPVNFYYDVISSDRIKFYLHAGGEAELCVGNRYTGYSTPQVKISQKVKDLQYSVGAGLGVEFTLSDKIGLYVDPGFRYYFYNSQPKSLRTEKPLFVNFSTGLRFSF